MNSFLSGCQGDADVGYSGQHLALHDVPHLDAEAVAPFQVDVSEWEGALVQIYPGTLVEAVVVDEGASDGVAAAAIAWEHSLLYDEADAGEGVGVDNSHAYLLVEASGLSDWRHAEDECVVALPSGEGCMLVVAVDDGHVARCEGRRQQQGCHRRLYDLFA